MKALLSTLAGMILGLTVDVSWASAQQPGRVYKIGVLFTGSPGFVPPPIEKWAGSSAVVRDGLRDAGFVAGKNIVVEIRHGNGDTARLAAEAAALVASDVDVIMTTGTPPTYAATQATKRIPIVFWGVAEPVERGLVASLAKPGGNVTGVAVMLAWAKQWELLHEVAPTVRRAPFLSTATGGYMPGDRAAANDELWVNKMKTYASSVGIEAFAMRVNKLAEVEAKFAELAREGTAGVLVINESLSATPEWRPFIMKLALEHRLPTSCAQLRDWAVSGCLVTYAEDWDAMARSRAAQIVKILRGVAPADIPVEQPTSYKLVINAKTAKELGLTVPSKLLNLADEVIE